MNVDRPVVTLEGMTLPSEKSAAWSALREELRDSLRDLSPRARIDLALEIVTDAAFDAARELPAQQIGDLVRATARMERCIDMILQGRRCCEG